MRPTRKRKFDWDGTKDEIVEKILGSSCIEQARERMAVTKGMRRDLDDQDLMCLELHMKLRFGRNEEAIQFFNEVKKDRKGFVHRVLFYIAEEFLRQGIDGVREFRDMIISYNHEEQVNLFLPVIKDHPHMACELWMTLLALVTDAIRRPLTKEEAVPVVTLQKKVLEHLESGGEPCRGLHHLGISMLKTQFVDLKPNQIFDTCDAIIKSGYKEFATASEKDSADNRNVCEMNGSKFMMCTYRFFYEVMKKLGFADVFPLSTNIKTISKSVMPVLSAQWSPPHRPVISYLIAIMKLRLPIFKTDELLVPCGPHFMVPEYSNPRNKNKVFADEGHFSDVFTALVEFADKFLPFHNDLDNTLSVIGQIEFFRWIAIAYFQTGCFDKGIGFCTEQWKTTKDVQFPIILLACLLEMKNYDKAAEVLAELVKHAKDGANTSSAPELLTQDHVIRGQKSLAHIPKDGLGHWVIIATSRFLQMHPKAEDPTVVDFVISSQIILSQLQFEEKGHGLMQHVRSSLEDKKSFNCEEIGKYIVADAILENLVTISQRMTCNFGKNWNPLELYKTTSQSPAAEEIIMRMLEFFVDKEESLLKLK